MPRESVLCHRVRSIFTPGLDGTAAFVKTSSKLTALPLGSATTCKEETASPMAPMAMVTPGRGSCQRGRRRRRRRRGLSVSFPNFSISQPSIYSCMTRHPSHHPSPPSLNKGKDSFASQTVFFDSFLHVVNASSSLKKNNERDRLF